MHVPTNSVRTQPATRYLHMHLYLAAAGRTWVLLRTVADCCPPLRTCPLYPLVLSSSYYIKRSLNQHCSRTFVLWEAYTLLPLHVQIMGCIQNFASSLDHHRTLADLCVIVTGNRWFWGRTLWPVNFGHILHRIQTCANTFVNTRELWGTWAVWCFGTLPD